MSDPAPPTSPADRPLDRLVNGLLDTFVYAPLGLALLARDEVPKLAAQGRQRVQAQADVARMVGQLAVAQGRRQVRSVTDRLTAPRRDRPPSPRVPADAPSPGRAVHVRDLHTEDRLPVPTGETLPEPAPETAVAADSPVPPPPPPSPPPSPGPPSAADLPIPGYDTLSAPQVVQRLPGPSPEELDAARA